MLRVKQIRNMSHYALSDEGSEAIEMFEYQIPNSIKEDIAQFLKEKEYELRKETPIFPFSALSKQGREEIWDFIESMVLKQEEAE